MDREMMGRLAGQAALGEEAEAALRVCERLFPGLREEIYRELEGAEPPDMVMLRARLLALRSVEGRLGAYVRSGQMAMRDITRD